MNTDLQGASTQLREVQSLVEMVQANRSLIVDGCLALLVGQAILCGVIVGILSVFSSVG
ncbi:MAG: hypothetical protein VYA34_08065 [Myxococcota bacterium]|nr:hypothetical protein [Myxococcota bacterium]